MERSVGDNGGREYECAGKQGGGWGLSEEEVGEDCVSGSQVRGLMSQEPRAKNQDFHQPYLAVKHPAW